MRFNYIQLNVFSSILYGLAFLIERETGYSLPLQIIGIIYLLFVTPFTIIQIFPTKSFSALEKYFSLLVFFFCLYVPVYYILNQVFHFSISIAHTFIINTIIFLAVAGIKAFIPTDETTLLIPKHATAFLKKEYLLISALFLYFGLHALNYRLYGFIPEWDSYSDLIKIQLGLADGFIQHTYRGFFSASAQVLSNFSGIDPYHIFSVIFISLQSVLILVIRALLDIYRIKKISLQIIAYVATLSVPVLNMEIDMTRPQNMVILLFPILFYFSYRFLSEKNISCAILTGLIALAGMNYHEFFVFPLIIFAGWITFNFLHKAFRANDRKDRYIYSLASTVIGLLAILIVREFDFLNYALVTAHNIFSLVLNISEWRVWFIGNYASDGTTLKMGWLGIDGAIKYYAYYLSPMLGTALIAFAYLAFKSEILKDHLIRITLPFFVIFISFAEILPRLNYLYLPERFWLLIDIILILTFIPFLKQFTGKRHEKITTSILVLLCILGISGSLYIAANKKSLTSENEYRASRWIRENTSEKAVFISQSANGPMIQFFGQRTLLPIDSEYFVSQKLLEQSPEKEIEELRESLDDHFSEVNNLVEKFTSNQISFIEFANSIQTKKSAVMNIRTQIDQWEKAIDQPKYIVYSYDKFNTLYKDREWWLTTNAYGASLEKFNQAYPLVYQEGGVYIWKVR